jgi:hypothetical protein
MRSENIGRPYKILSHLTEKQYKTPEHGISPGAFPDFVENVGPPFSGISKTN